MPTLSELKQREEGFTLIELLVVIIIIGILAAIAIPLFLDQRKLAVDASVKSDVRNTVANITTQQGVATGQNSTTVNYAAVVSPGNTLVITDTTSTPNTTATHTPSARTGSLPLNSNFSINAYNASGKKYIATASGYAFNSATGQFG